MIEYKFTTSIYRYFFSVVLTVTIVIKTNWILPPSYDVILLEWEEETKKNSQIACKL